MTLRPQRATSARKASTACMHKGCRIDRVTVECSVEDFLKMTTEFIGQTVTVGTAKIGSTYTDHEATVPFYESYVKKDAGTLERVTDFKLLVAKI